MKKPSMHTLSTDRATYCFLPSILGLQNYMAYSYSVLYSKSGGTGRGSSLAVAAITSILFVVGPSIAKFIPRCMAGTLLAHIGIDLMVEGVYECKFLSHD
jgi:MFS superfamily sulfate permease-like transporter